MSRMSQAEFIGAVKLFDDKRLKESKITQEFMDLYIANEKPEDMEEYAALADDKTYLKDIVFTVNGKKNTRTARDVEKIRKWFFAKYAPGYKVVEGKSKKASVKLVEKLEKMKF